MAYYLEQITATAHYTTEAEKNGLLAEIRTFGAVSEALTASNYADSYHIDAWDEYETKKEALDDLATYCTSITIDTYFQEIRINGYYIEYYNSTPKEYTACTLYEQDVNMIASAREIYTTI